MQWQIKKKNVPKIGLYFFFWFKIDVYFLKIFPFLSDNNQINQYTAG